MIRRRPLLFVLVLSIAVSILAAAAAIAANRNPAPTKGSLRFDKATLSQTRAACGARAGAKGHVKRVIWVWMENHSAGTVLDPKASPYLSKLARACGVTTDSHNITHPSLPNYIAATSGGTQGITDDCGPDDCPVSAPSLFGQISAAGKTWRSYQESMPEPCGHANAGRYAPKHNPAVYYDDARARCGSWDVSLDALTSDLARHALPDFAFVTPDLCSDTHDCPVGTGDDWLSRFVPRLTGTAAYRRGEVALIVTWDEGEGGGSIDCLAHVKDRGCQIATVVASARTRPGTVDRERLSHYSLLRTTEELLGLPKLGRAKSAHSMRAAFGL